MRIQPYEPPEEPPVQTEIVVPQEPINFPGISGFAEDQAHHIACGWIDRIIAWLRNLKRRLWLPVPDDNPPEEPPQPLSPTP